MHFCLVNPFSSLTSDHKIKFSLALPPIDKKNRSIFHAHVPVIFLKMTSRGSGENVIGERFDLYAEAC